MINKISNGVKEKDLLNKLNQLKSITPDSAWKASCREILYSQMTGQNLNEIESDQFSWRMFWGDLIPNVNVKLPQTVWIIILSISIMTSGGLASVYAARDSKPGDSLYIAKIISEKTKLVLTFDDKEKAKLNLEFAANRAKESVQVLEENTSAEKKDAKLQELTKNFKDELNQAKNKLGKINVGSRVWQDEENKTEALNQVFGANLGKDDQRMEISEPTEEIKETETKPAQEADQATSTTENLSKNNSLTTDKILEQAEMLFDQKNYNQSIDKLNQVNKIINQADDDKGEVKGTSESATSTADVKDVSETATTTK